MFYVNRIKVKFDLEKEQLPYALVNFKKNIKIKICINQLIKKKI